MQCAMAMVMPIIAIFTIQFCGFIIWRLGAVAAGGGKEKRYGGKDQLQATFT
jgi:hypothetical protein